MNSNRLVLEGADQYSILRSVQVGAGNDPVYLGTKGKCRFCETVDEGNFSKIAHAIPEALGNKWLISRDECDNCNEASSIYEDALAKAVSPFLTVGGMRGKRNRVRQTGRTGGGTFVAQKDGPERRQLHFSASNVNRADVLSSNHAAGTLTLTMPVAAVPFVPRFAHKALLKMAIALLPDEELPSFNEARKSLADRARIFPNAPLEVVASFGSIGNAPPIVAACLLRRQVDDARYPSTMFVLYAGSICLRIRLHSDQLDSNLPEFSLSSMYLPSRAVLGPPGVQPIVIEYLHQKVFDWASSDSSPQPVAAMKLDFDPITRRGSFSPMFRTPPVDQS